MQLSECHMTFFNLTQWIILNYDALFSNDPVDLVPPPFFFLMAETWNVGLCCLIFNSYFLIWLS